MRLRSNRNGPNLGRILAAALAISTVALALQSRAGRLASAGSVQQGGSAPGAQAPTPQDDAEAIQRFNAERAGALAKDIKGKEDSPAGEVFKNVKQFKSVPAGRFLKIMEFGYSPALGVKCTHCHVENDWASESMPEKRIAREMSGMVQTINGTLLKNIDGLKGPNPIVNCTTCHRGQVKPALNLPARSAR